jgi:predicted ester cyclase
MTSLFESLKPVPALVQAAGMKGFAAEFQDLDHYIRVITDRIWEERRIDDIRLYYSDPCIVETGTSVSTALEDVVTGTVANLVMFPDRTPRAEDVIQSGDAHSGFLSSHRAISVMTHLGDGIFGPPTGRKIHAHGIADCVCINNRIVHEWLVRDQAAIALQIGTTPKALAQQWLNQRGGWNKPVAGPAPAGYVSHISTDPLAVRYAQTMSALIHDKSLVDSNSSVASIYDVAAQQIGPGESTCYGHGEIAEFWHGMFGALRVEQFDIEHLAMQSDMQTSGRHDRVALRFRAKTVHNPRPDCTSRYGTGSNRPVEVLGIVHAEFVKGRVIREWVLIDDVATWMQILTPQA